MKKMIDEKSIRTQILSKNKSVILLIAENIDTLNDLNNFVIKFLEKREDREFYKIKCEINELSQADIKNFIFSSNSNNILIQNIHNVDFRRYAFLMGYFSEPHYFKYGNHNVKNTNNYFIISSLLIDDNRILRRKLPSIIVNETEKDSLVF